MPDRIKTTQVTGHTETTLTPKQKVSQVTGHAETTLPGKFKVFQVVGQVEWQLSYRSKIRVKVVPVSHWKTDGDATISDVLRLYGE